MVQIRIENPTHVFGWKVSSGDGRILGFAPRTKDSIIENIRCGTMEQGPELYGEKSVYHHKKNGKLSAYPDDLFKINPSPWDTRFTMVDPGPVLVLKRGMSDITIGNILVPENGAILHEKPVSGTPYPIFWGGSNKGHLYITITTTKWSIVKAVYWYSSDFLRVQFVSTNISLVTNDPVLFRSRVLEELHSDPFGSLGKPLPDIVGGRASGVYILPPSVNSRPSISAIGPPHSYYPVVPDRNKLLGDLCKQVIEQMNIMSFNGVLFVKEILNIKSLLPPKEEFLRIKKTPRHPKAWANVYLWLRYGIKLSIRDITSLARSIPKLIDQYHSVLVRKRRLRGRKSFHLQANGTDWNVTMGYRVIFNEYPESLKKLGKTLDTMYSLDLMPTYQNLWDMIPYSFVVDWFIPVSTWLDAVDYHSRVQQFSFETVTTSEKFVAIVKNPKLRGYVVLGQLTETHYRRDVGRTLHPQVLDFESGQDPSVRRCIDGSALTVQKFFRNSRL